MHEADILSNSTDGIFRACASVSKKLALHVPMSAGQKTGALIDAMAQHAKQSRERDRMFSELRMLREETQDLQIKVKDAELEAHRLLDQISAAVKFRFEANTKHQMLGASNDTL